MNELATLAELVSKHPEPAEGRAARRQGIRSMGQPELLTGKRGSALQLAS